MLSAQLRKGLCDHVRQIQVLAAPAVVEQLHSARSLPLALLDAAVCKDLSLIWSRRQQPAQQRSLLESLGSEHREHQWKLTSAAETLSPATSCTTSPRHRSTWSAEKSVIVTTPVPAG